MTPNDSWSDYSAKLAGFSDDQLLAELTRRRNDRAARALQARRALNAELLEEPARTFIVRHARHAGRCVANAYKIRDEDCVCCVYEQAVRDRTPLPDWFVLTIGMRCDVLEDPDARPGS